MQDGKSNDGVTFSVRREFRPVLELISMRTNPKFFLAFSLVVFVACSVTGRAFGQDASKEMEFVCQNIHISPENRSFTADGGSAFINVDHEANCTFTATSSAKWITVTSVIVGTDIGTVYYSVASYGATTPRSGTISVGSQTFVIHQIPETFQGAPPIVWTGMGHTGSVNGVAFSPDGQLLASASSDHTVKVWHVADGTLLRTLTGFFDSVTSVAFSHNGQILAAGSIDRRVKAWRVGDWSVAGSEGTGDFILSVAFSPDDTQLAAAGGYSGNWIHLIRTSDWQDIALLGAGQQQNTSISYSPDGQYLAWAIDGPGVRLQRMPTGSFCMLSEDNYYAYTINSVAFSPNGQQIASGSDSQSVEIWQVANCAESQSFNGPAGFVKSVAYTPDGQMIVAGGQDWSASRGTLLFWRVVDGALLRVYLGETSTAVRAVQYSPNGSRFAYGREDGAVVLARDPFRSSVPPR